LVTIGTSVFVAGDFSSYRTSSNVGNVVKLSGTDGALDTAFSTPGVSAGFNGSVYALAVSGNALYVGGSFDGYRGVVGSASTLAKLDPVTGALDPVFTPSGANEGNNSVELLAPYRDSLLAGGYIQSCVDGVCYGNAFRFNRLTRAPQ
jgi:hypothetical protein